MKITSVNNDLIKERAKLLKSKYRDETGLFILEGDKCIREALDSGLELVNIFSIEGFEDLPQRIEVTEAVLTKISDTKTPPSAVAIAKKPEIKHDRFKSMNRLILLEGIKDAGNLGTIIRTAAAFNIDGIILYGDTVDLYNPKTVRSAVGNLWKIPVININDYALLEKLLSDFEKVGTLPKSDNTVWLKDYKPASKTVIMFGSEADGLSTELKNFADKNITIEMSEKVESLNLSVSASIIMYKFI